MRAPAAMRADTHGPWDPFIEVLSSDDVTNEAQDPFFSKINFTFIHITCLLSHDIRLKIPVKIRGQTSS